MPLIVHILCAFLWAKGLIYFIFQPDETMSTDNKQSSPAITLAAIGVVYGDIGTGDTLRECLSGQFGFGVERDAVFGFLSLIFWLLNLCGFH